MADDPRKTRGPIAPPSPRSGDTVRSTEGCCPVCRSSVSSTARFCDQCGARLGDQPAAPAPPAWPEERKLVAILFADIAGFTALSSRLEPDAVRELANECFEPLAEEIRRRGGTVIKYIGDCVMAAFGVPCGAEDDPRRAVQAGLAMSARVDEISRRIEDAYGAPINMRIGIHYGQVMVGTVGSGAGAAPDLMGSAVNLASRIQGVAQPGQVVISPTVLRIVKRQFEVESIGVHSLKGIAEKVAVFRVIQELSEERGLSAEISIPFSLREAELASLLAHFDATRESGKLKAIKVIGEPGMGQTRLLKSLRSGLEGDFAQVLSASSTMGAVASVTPLRPITRMLRHRCGVRSDAPAAQGRAALVSGIAQAWADAGVQDELNSAQTLAELAAPSAGPTAAGEDHSFSRDQALRAFVAWLEQLAARHPPLCLQVEDLQWADEATLEFIERLLLAAQGCPMLLVLGMRPELEERRPGFAASCERLVLAPIAASKMREFVDHLFLEVPAVPAEVREELVARAEGSPACARELIRLLLDRGALVLPDDGSFGSWHPERLGTIALPETVQGVLQARLDRLPVAEKELLKRASVIGRSFWHGALEALVPPAQQPGLASLLASLEGRGLVRASPSSMEGEVEYQFHRQALRDIAYDLLPRQARQAAHRAVAGWLEARAGLWEGGHAEIAGHLDAGGERDRASVQYLQAARQAARLFANDQASGFYRRALEIWRTGTRPAERSAALREMSQVLAYQGKFEEGLAVLDQTRDEVRASGLPDTDRELAAVELQRGLVLKEAGGRSQEALDAFDRAVALVERGTPHLLHMQLYGWRAALRADRGSRAGAEEDIARGMAISERVRPRDSGWHLAMALLAVDFGEVSLHSGQLGQAEASFRRGLEFGQLAGAQRTRLTAHNNLGAIAFARSDFAAAAREFASALVIARTTHRRRDMAICLSNLGQAHLAAGSLDPALRDLRDARELSREMRLVDVLADCTRALAEVALARGEAQEALAAAAEAVEYSRRSGHIDLEGIDFEVKAREVAIRALLAGARPPGGQPPPALACEHLAAAARTLRAAGRQAEAEGLESRYPSLRGGG